MPSIFRINHSLVQKKVAILSGIRVKPHKDLLSVVYPVADSGAAEQLSHIPKERRPEVTARIRQQFKLDLFGMNATESLLCETSVTRAGYIKEYLVRGMDMFYLSKDGVPMVKCYGTTEWIIV